MEEAIFQQMATLGIYPSTRFLKIKYRHHSHSQNEKRLYRKDNSVNNKNRTECFDDDYFPCKRDNDYKLKQIKNWLSLLVCARSRDHQKGCCEPYIQSSSSYAKNLTNC
jgi:hypothetical protein